MSGRGLRKIYEIGNTKHRNPCQPRPQNGLRVSRVPYLPSPVYIPNEFISNHGQFNGQYNRGPNYRGPPKRRDTTDFECLKIGEMKKSTTDGAGCTHVFGTIKAANVACRVYENCLLIGRNSDGNFELFSESEDNTAIDLDRYELFFPDMDKTKISSK